MRLKLVPVLLPAVALLLLLAPPARAQMATGSYTGDGSSNLAITGVGFQPDIVFVKNTGSFVAYCRSSSMSGDNSKSLGGATALAAGAIKSLDADGFTVGSNTAVNSNGVAHYWIAFKANPGQVAAGSYGGNGADDRSITGVGFQPAYVIVMSAGANEAVHRSAAVAGDTTLFFGATVPSANLIQALEGDGVQVGTAAQVNTNGTTYHYVAWRAIARQMNVGSYAGDGIDDRNISGVGFAPDWVVVRSDGDKETVHHPASIGRTTDSTLWFIANAALADAIQQLQSDGFQVGKSDKANKNTLNYYWMAFGSGRRRIAVIP
jgi:hypothetical protein